MSPPFLSTRAVISSTTLKQDAPRIPMNAEGHQYYRRCRSLSLPLQAIRGYAYIALAQELRRKNFLLSGSSLLALLPQYLEEYLREGVFSRLGGALAERALGPLWVQMGRTGFRDYRVRLGCAG